MHVSHKAGTLDRIAHLRRLDRERHIAEQLTCAFGRESPVVREEVDFIFRGLIGFREMRRNNPQKRALNLAEVQSNKI